MGRTDKQQKSQEQHEIKDQSRWIQNDENEEGMQKRVVEIAWGEE